MDLVPTLPPTQDALPVSVSDATLASTPSVAVASNQPAVAPPERPSLTGLPAGLIRGLASIEPIGVEGASLSRAPLSMGFVSASGLSDSFNFIERAFRSARRGSVAGQPIYSGTLPVQWVSEDSSWEGKLLAADIRVKRIAVTAQVAQLENQAWSADFIDQCMPGAERQLQAGTRYKISLGDRTLGYVADENRAYLLAQQLKRLIQQSSFDPDVIAPYPIAADNSLHGANAIIGTPGQPIFAINEAMSTAIGYSPSWAAVSWANNLRIALDADPLQPGEALMTLKGLEESKIDMAGEASWYGPYFHGRATANGEIYDQYALTVAHKSLPFGTQLKIRNTVNDKTVVVRVNDRGPYVGDRILDLSRAAADCLGSDETGVVPVEATVLRKARN